jgi:hypothetical protein
VASWSCASIGTTLAPGWTRPCAEPEGAIGTRLNRSFIASNDSGVSVGPEMIAPPACEPFFQLPFAPDFFFSVSRLLRPGDTFSLPMSTSLDWLRLRPPVPPLSPPPPPFPNKESDREEPVETDEVKNAVMDEVELRALRLIFDEALRR